MVVYCKTQKEWDHICEILKNNFGFSTFSAYPCINTTIRNACQTLEYYQKEGYSIISYEEFLKFKNITTMKYKEGDIIATVFGDKRKILGICGQVYFVSNLGNFNIASGARTEKELIDYHLYEDTPIKEVTLADISKALNIPIDKLRIKD